MFQWISLTTLNLIYIGLMSVGVLYAVIILIAGGLGQIHLPHIEIPHVDFNPGDLDIGGVHVPDSNIHVDLSSTPDVNHGEVSVRSLSAVSIASFITAFGAFGILAIQLMGLTSAWSLLVAAGGGLVVGAIVQVAFGYFLIAPQGSSEVRVNDIVGAVGEVITPIPAGHVGEIAFVARGARVTSSARSADGSAIPRGAIVKVTNMVGSVVLVAPAEPPPAPPPT